MDHARQPPRLLNRHRDFVPDDAVYIGRGTPWGNPFVHGSRKYRCERFDREVLHHLDLEPLRGRDLVCSCAPLRCHGEGIMQRLYDARPARTLFGEK